MSYCAKCGASLERGNTFCPSCGTPVTSSTPPTSAAPSTPSFPQRSSRPGGVTLLAILEGIVSFFMLFGGIALIGLSALLAVGGWDIIPEEELAQALQQIPWASTFTSIPIIAFTTFLVTIIGIILLTLALIGFIMTWGLWSGKSWARTISMILAVISILTGIFSLPGSIVSILINIVILYYLTRPYIQTYYQ